MHENGFVIGLGRKAKIVFQLKLGSIINTQYAKAQSCNET